MKTKRIPVEYPGDLIHIDRWMCSKCGLIFDFLPGSNPDEPGWISLDPQFNIDYLVDKDGNYHEMEMEQKEICPRCKSDLNEVPLQRIFVSATTTLDDIKPIIKQGEGELVEFMVKYPDNVHELAKEIAAFSTTKGGKILLGIKDNGEIVGLQEINTPEGIDILTKRIRGVAEKIVPKVDLSVDVISENDTRIIIISVRKGVMPYYECEGKVYIRDLDSSRPATYDEKIRLSAGWVEKKSKAG